MTPQVGIDSSAVEAHIAGCRECQENLYGLCKTALALIGRMAGMRDDANQPELLKVEALPAVQERPMTRMYVRDIAQGRFRSERYRETREKKLAAEDRRKQQAEGEKAKLVAGTREYRAPYKD